MLDGEADGFIKFSINIFNDLAKSREVKNWIHELN